MLVTQEYNGLWLVFIPGYFSGAATDGTSSVRSNLTEGRRQGIFYQILT